MVALDRGKRSVLMWLKERSLRELEARGWRQKEIALKPYAANKVSLKRSDPQRSVL